jgi:cytochrome d ubiquinol oxidase subunit II
VALVVLAWGLAQRPYLIPTSLTVSQAAGASTTLRWLMLVTVIAVVLVGPPLVLLYRLDTRGALQPLTEADLRQTAAGRDPENL